MLEVTDLTVSYGPVTALHGVSLRVEPGELVAVLGANGAGKSTLLQAISGLVATGSGRVVLDGRDVVGTRAERIARSGVAHVPEGRRIFPGLSVEQNLVLGASSRTDDRDLAPDFARVFELFPILRDRAKQGGWSLSGGEQQMLAVGRALMGRPRLLMLDEPSLGLAPIPVREVLAAIRQVTTEGTGTILVEQNVRAAMRIADRVYVLQNGRVVQEGRVADFEDDAQLRASYMGI